VPLKNFKNIIVFVLVLHMYIWYIIFFCAWETWEERSRRKAFLGQKESIEHQFCDQIWSFVRGDRESWGVRGRQKKAVAKWKGAGHYCVCVAHVEHAGQVLLISQRQQ